MGHREEARPGRHDAIQVGSLARMALTMYDAIDLESIPRDAQAVAGYVGGNWPTFHELAHRWPHARHLSIAVQADEDAQALDVEAGDATPAEAPAWVRRQIQRGVSPPVIYVQLSTVPQLQADLRAAGIPRASYRLWTAHWTGKPHRCSRRCLAGWHDRAGATQWTDRAEGRSLDVSSVFGPGFFP